ncbi:hypothetical protein BZG36_03396 [Bifiguratus adelaidae]|uniref:Small ribosomal subunit protein uS17 n=1 Tax=Bifiguratus adelaidae TaxID=1938954 RepID=A0A261Y0D6_9FUNG|nr:hypothetical protein BZG36_03396 [Bifiguratus adelaidae]
MSEQVERSFQKQGGVYLNSKKAKQSSKTLRWYKDVGLGFKTPREAIEGTYIDKKCPFTGDVSIRGRILTGVVVSVKMNRTLIIRREYLHYIPKYNRYEKRHKNLAAHCSPAFIGIGIAGQAGPGGSGMSVGGSSKDDEEKKSQMEEMRHNMLAQILDHGARERLARITMVRAERGRAVEDMLIRMAQSGQLRQKVNETQLIDLLSQLNESQGSGGGGPKIVYNRRQMVDDDDSDYDL